MKIANKQKEQQREDLPCSVNGANRYFILSMEGALPIHIRAATSCKV
jgi:hypothetical protein